MRKTSFALALLTAAVLSACGGSSPRGGDQTPGTKFSAQVSFGDSLSDVGTYAVGTVKALGGGKFTINGDNTSISKDLTGKNWTEFVAAQLKLPAPCPAQTGLNGDASKGFNVPVTFNRCGSMFCGYFTSEPVWNLADAMKADRERFKKFFHGMLDAGVYLAPSQFEAGFISTAHTEADLEKTISAAARVMKAVG